MIDTQLDVVAVGNAMVEVIAQADEAFLAACAMLNDREFPRERAQPSTGRCQSVRHSCFWLWKWYRSQEACEKNLRRGEDFMGQYTIGRSAGAFPSRDGGTVR